MVVPARQFRGIYSIAFSPTADAWPASDDGTANVWDASSGQVLLTLTGHNGWSMASPSARMVSDL
jgi:WD40 repeat protein